VKILVAIANYGTKNMVCLRAVTEECRSMSYRTDIVVFSNISKELGPGVEIRGGLPLKNSWSLPFGHRKVFSERANDAAAWFVNFWRGAGPHPAGLGNKSIPGFVWPVRGGAGGNSWNW